MRRFPIILMLLAPTLIWGCSHDQVAAPEASDSQTGTDGQIAPSGDVVTLTDLQAGMGGGAKLAGPDVAITAFTASPTNLLPGDTLTLQATVANVGSAPAQGPFDVWIGVLNTGFEFARVTLNQLAPGQSRSGVVNFTIPAAKLAKAYPPGTYTLYCTHNFGDSNASNDYMLADVTLFDATPAGFVMIPPGTFQMGSPTDEPGRYTNETLHTVTLTQGFYMSTTEVTEEWWDAVMGSGSSTSQLPKANVNWDDAVAFCNQLSLDEGLTPAYTINGPNGDATWNHAANGYRLPTEAEWEYACRAGSQTAFCNGPITYTDCTLDPNLDQVGWYCGNAGGVSHVVGQKAANAWGLYDMHGNLFEWVWDGLYDDYQDLPSADPVYDVGPGAYRVVRGGYWNAYAQHCRSACRASDYPTDIYVVFGFRPVRSAF